MAFNWLTKMGVSTCESIYFQRRAKLTEHGERRIASIGRSDVAVVRSNWQASVLPLEEDRLASERQRLGPVVSDGGAASDSGSVHVLTRFTRGKCGVGRVGNTAASYLVRASVVGVNAVDVGVVDDVEGWEVLPRQSSCASRASRDVWCKHGPRPTLGDTTLKPHIHGCETAHLTEDLLLSTLGSDRLSKQLTDLARVEMVDIAPDTRLTETSQALAEIYELADCGVRVVVGALGRGSLAKHVGQQSRVTALRQTVSQLCINVTRPGFLTSWSAINSINERSSAVKPASRKSWSLKTARPLWNKSSSIHSWYKPRAIDS